MNKINLYSNILEAMKNKKTISNSAYHLAMGQLWMLLMGGVGTVGLANLNVSNINEAVEYGVNALGIATGSFRLKTVNDPLYYKQARESKGVMGKLVTKGLPSLIGVDFSNALKVALPNPLVGGVWGSISKDITRAGQYVKYGEKLKAIETVLPGQIKVAAKQVREYLDGVTYKGQQIITKEGEILRPSLPSAFVRGLLGVQPISKKTMEMEKVYNRINVERKWRDAKQAVTIKARKLLRKRKINAVIKLVVPFNDYLNKASGNLGYVPVSKITEKSIQGYKKPR